MPDTPLKNEIIEWLKNQNYWFQRVSVERLKDVVVLPQFTSKLIDKVGLLSRFIEAHLHSDTFGSPKPTSDDLKKEIDDFIILQKRIRSAEKRGFGKASLK